MCCITHMAEQRFSNKRRGALEVYLIELLLQLHAVEITNDMPKNAFNRVVRSRAQMLQVFLSRRHIELHSCHARAVLPSIALFFHQREQLFHPPSWIPVALDVMRDRFSQPHKSNAAFMRQLFITGISLLGNGKRERAEPLDRSQKKQSYAKYLKENHEKTFGKHEK